MYRAIPSQNRHIKEKEEKRNRTIHLEHLRNVRPTLTAEEGAFPVVLHHGKKEAALENKYTEIERENRILLEKIAGIFTGNRRTATGTISANAVNKSPRSLNVTIRRKRLQDIEVSNARLLKRLQQRKSDYEVDKLRKQWKKQKEVIKNISSYPVTILGSARKPGTSTVVKMPRVDMEKLFDVNRTYELSRVKVIDWYTFHVVVRLDRNGLTITANNSSSRDIKVIEIDRGEALDFIRMECNNQLENIFERLKYDGKNMLLVGDQDAFQKDLQNYASETARRQTLRTPEAQTYQNRDAGDAQEVRDDYEFGGS